MDPREKIEETFLLAEHLIESFGMGTEDAWEAAEELMEEVGK